MNASSSAAITEPRVSDLLDEAAARLRAGVGVDEAALAIASAKSLLSALAIASGQHGILAPIQLHDTVEAFPRWAVVLQEQR